MIRWLLLLALALWFALLVLVLAGYAKADEPVQVTPGLVCAVQSAVKLHRQPLWTPNRCEVVAAALNETPNPRQMAAICTNESDWNNQAVVEVRPGVYDVGLCGVRCVLEDEPAREGRRSSAGPNPKHTTLTPSGRCANGPARGYSLQDLFDPVTNIRVATSVLAGHGGNLKRYNGGTREHGYEARIAAIMSALGGVEVRVKGARMRKLVGQIAKATRP